MQISITRRALETVLAGARSADPIEFLCLLIGKMENGRLTIEDTAIPHGLAASESMFSVSEWLTPAMENVVGTFHSHPSGPNKPSPADIRVFSKMGGVHLIAKRPFGKKDVRAYDSSGNELNYSIG